MPPTRPTTALRERIIDRLSAGYAEGALELPELERRLTTAHRSESDAELEGLVADLPAVSEKALTVAPRRPVEQNLRAPTTPVARTLSVFSSTTRRGQWAVPRRMQVKAIFGNVELDFREAVMPPGPVDLEVRAIFGNIEITVPPQLAVESDGSAVLGNFDLVDRAPVRAEGDAPVLRVHGRSIFGNVEVKLGFMERMRALIGKLRGQ